MKQADAVDFVSGTKNVVVLQPCRPEAPPTWEFTLNRKTFALELVVLDDAGNPIAAISFRHVSTTPGFDLCAAWERAVGELPPLH